MVMEFFRVYGVLLACVAAILALSATLAACVGRVKKLERAIEAMKKELLTRLDEQQKTLYEEQKKERRLLNEGMANLTESVTRAVFSVKAEMDKKGE